MNELSTYHWEHEKLFWHGSRASKSLLTQKNPPIPLLGSTTTDIMEHEIRWQDLHELSELLLFQGHQLQGHEVYPATAQIATVAEAARFLVPNE